MGSVAKHMSYSRCSFIPHPTYRSLFVVLDPPHCPKNTRNALIKYDVLLSPGKSARWKDLQRLWYLKNRGQLWLAPKLIAAHVEPPSFQLALRAVALANMLKPSGSQNCEDDNDRLLVSVLQKVRMLFAVSELIPSLRRAGDDNARPEYIN